MIAKSIKTFALCSTALATLTYGSSALAQDNAAEEVVVTGSRVITNGFAQPTPVTVVTMEQMQATAPNSLMDAITQLPQFKSSFIAQSSGFLAGAGSGGAFLNLRGLGITRNLTLLDGQRVVNAGANGSSAGAVDINMMPQQLVRRVDVVTGGASAAYGTDALSGVTNFILDSKFTGIKGELRGSITSRSDNEQEGYSLAIGRPFAGGRGHIVASVEYNNSEGIKDYTDRAWALKGSAIVTNVNCPTPQTSLSCPTRFLAAPLMPANMSSGGLVIGGATALRGRYFTDSNVTAAFPYGTNLTYAAGSPTPTQTSMIGGGLPQDQLLGAKYSNVPGSKRGNAFMRVGYDVTPNWNVWATGMYGTNRSDFIGTLHNPSHDGNFLLFQDNAYVSPALAAQIGGPGATTQALVNPATGLLTGTVTPYVTVGRIGTDWQPLKNFGQNAMTRFAAGADGSFGLFGRDWKLSAWYTHGLSKRKTGGTDEFRISNLLQSVDAVRSPGGAGLPAAGTPICRSTISSPNNACVPVNIMGNQPLNAAQVFWLESGTANGTSNISQSLKQDAAELTVRTELFTLPAGPVTVAFGVDYRREAAVGVADAVSESYIGASPGPGFVPGVTPILNYNLALSGSTVTRGSRAGWQAINPGGYGPNSINVKEVYGEALIPLVHDHPFATSWDLNGAIRYADYQYGGGQTNWKVGMVYRYQDLRIRVTESHDIRAPNIANLFAGVSVSNGAVSDPFRRGTTGTNESNTNAPTLSSGNPDLKPETGDTFTLGFVYQPSWNKWIDGFSLSFDYYNILVRSAIGNGGGLTACFNGETYYCQFIIRNTDPATFGAGNTIGPITQVYSKPVNTGGTKLTGIDIEASYRLPLSKIWEGRRDSLTLRVLANGVKKNCGIPTGTATSITCSVGTVSGGVVAGSGGNSDWQGTFNANYSNGPLTINWQTRFINKGRLNANVDFDGNPYPANILVNPNTQLNGSVPNVVPSYFYSDLTVNYKFSVLGGDRNMEAFLTINNLFDKDPPALGSLFFYGAYPTNITLYDAIGRAYSTGLRFRF